MKSGLLYLNKLSMVCQNICAKNRFLHNKLDDIILIWNIQDILFVDESICFIEIIIREMKLWISYI